MTYSRLIQELGPGEIAYQIAYDELDAEARTERVEHAKVRAERRRKARIGMEAGET